MKPLVAIAVGRDGVLRLNIHFNRPPTEDEKKAIECLLKRPPPICPFCQKPHYGALPCCHCGEPDMPEF